MKVLCLLPDRNLIRGNLGTSYSEFLIFRERRWLRASDVAAQLVECLTGTHKTLNSVPSSTQCGHGPVIPALGRWRQGYQSDLRDPSNPTAKDTEISGSLGMPSLPDWPIHRLQAHCGMCAPTHQPKRICVCVCMKF